MPDETESTISTTETNAPETTIATSETGAAPETATGTPPAETAPSYTVEAPDGYDKEAFIKFATENKIDPKAAQSFLDREVNTVNATFERAAAEHKAEVAKWADTLKNDKEFGGESFKGNAARVSTFVKQHATPGFIELLNKTGLGNHPDVVKTFHKLAQLAGSDRMVSPNANPPAEKELSLSERLYPNMTKK